MGIAPTNRQVRFNEMAMVRFANGLIVESRWETDMVSLYQQLGVLPPEGPAATRDTPSAPTVSQQEKSIMASDIIEQNRQIGQRFVEFLTRGGDPSTLFSPDFVYYDAQGASHDLAGSMQLMQPILVAIPDRTIEVQEEIITDTRVVIRWRRSGTFQRDGWGVHATGNRFSDVGVTILGIGANNRISQIWEFVDFLNFFTQIGAIREYVANMGPAPAPAPGA
jgi:predicted ester cyclase